MKRMIQHVIFYCLIYSAGGHAAFTEPEISQLQAINDNSEKEMKSSLNLLKETLNRLAKDMPERKKEILDLSLSWNKTIEKKCQVKIHDSLNTDAEIAERNACLTSEYKLEKEFMEKINL
ncbi:hypothetical protein [Pantoea sp. BAV 3049]|uniref:hypothetical protein n=1 Tax=Pantoea sp. BAV 3049 TaxID=2654188 RepID=UPI00131EC204|nr:hypothetical protein [Pantoea sp. BAV 3049]